MDIAIIGLSGRFPNSPTLQLFDENLKQGKDLVRPLSYERISRTGLPYQNYQILGYLEDIDLFDSHFFGLSETEAESMDPHQRLLLEVIYETFESSGYSIEYFNGSQTGVFIGDVELQYYKHAKQFEPQLITGNLNSAVAGRIARYFNLRGSAQMIDSSCSSSLTALYYACNELELGNLDQAIVAGANLMLFPPTLNDVINGIESEDGKSRAFSIDASGTGSGEAACAVLIKPLKKAIQDNDLIHAIIKSVAINHGGSLSANLTAPDGVAQSQVIIKAFQKAGISPSTITYVEAHGTGTKLGDPIEIDGITKAFRHFTNETEFCAISSLKTNIGHTNGAAGLAGLIKVVLSLKSQVLYPSLHCEQTNPLIDFSNSPVFINTYLREWKLPARCPRRRASLNSFGFMGTNTHAVLEECLEYRQCNEDSLKPYLIVVSAKSFRSLYKNLRRLLHHLKNFPALSLQDLSYTLLTGRKHYPFRFACVVNDLSELAKEIDLSKEIINGVWKKKVNKLIFIFSGSHSITVDQLKDLASLHQGFQKLYKQCDALVTDENWQSENVRTFVFYYCFCGFLQENGMVPNHFIGDGIGKLIIDHIHAKISLHEAIEKAIGFQGSQIIDDLKGRVLRAVQRIGEIESMVFLECGSIGRLSNVLLSVPDCGRILSLEDNDQKAIVKLFSDLYCTGLPINWNNTLFSKKGKRIELPTYAFSRTRCWLSSITSYDSSRWYYQIDWKELALEELVEQNSETWLFVYENDEAYSRNKKLFSKIDAINVRLGDFFQILNHREVVIDIQKQDVLSDIFRFLASKGSKIKNLAYFFSKNNRQAYGELSIQRYFLIVKAFCKEVNSCPTSLLTFTFDALSITENDRLFNCYQSVLHGFNIALISEYPGSTIRCIDLDNISSQDIENISLREIGSKSSLVSVGYRGGMRFCRYLNRIDSQAKTDGMYLQENGVYIVTGGSSGIGLEIVKWLAVKCPIKIVVIGRRELPKKIEWYAIDPAHTSYGVIQAFMKAEEYGSDVFYFPADLSNNQQVQTVIDEVVNEHGEIGGIIHAAGVTGSSRLERHDWDSFYEGLRAKVMGTIFLGRKLDSANFPFFILFSSLNSLIGVERGTNYSAANCFLDNYASVLRKRGFNAHVINWTSWKETGMWHRANHDDENDFESLLNFEGLAVLEDILSNGYQDIIVSKTNPLSVVSSSYLIGNVASVTTMAEIKVVNENPAIPLNVDESMKKMWFNTLKVNPEQSTDDFFQLGGHSLSALKLILEVEKRFGIKLEIADVLECSSFGKMCDLVNKLVEMRSLESVNSLVIN